MTGVNGMNAKVNLIGSLEIGRLLIRLPRTSIWSICDPYFCSLYWFDCFGVRWAPTLPMASPQNCSLCFFAKHLRTHTSQLSRQLTRRSTSGHLHCDPLTDPTLAFTRPHVGDDSCLPASVALLLSSSLHVPIIHFHIVSAVDQMESTESHQTIRKSNHYSPALHSLSANLKGKNNSNHNHTHNHISRPMHLNRLCTLQLSFASLASQSHRRTFTVRSDRNRVNQSNRCKVRQWHV